ncbi:MAG: DUF4105 domain-containing protein [Myxococcales bacterium]|nr:DUF4105 domain-containing protein [Myxococcales bacterium]
MRYALQSLLVLVLLGSGAPGRAAEAPRVAVYTMGPGADLFSRFGHAAICLHYRRATDDRCYNYGTADFDSPVPLTLGFLRGQALFWVDVSRPGEMLTAYRQNDRTIWRQNLPLSDAEALAIARRVARDALPQNRFYVYRVFADNCATKIRDIVDDATGGRLRSDGGTHQTFRQLIRPGFASEPLILFALDLFAGRASDRECTPWQAMFLPHLLRTALERHFGARPIVVYRRRGRPFSRIPPPVWYGWILLAALLATPIAVARWRELRGLPLRLAIALPTLVLTLISLAIWTLVLFSTPQELRWNEAALLFWPSDILLPFLGDSWRRRYARIRLSSFVILIVLLAIGVLHQPLSSPLASALAPLSLLAVDREDNAVDATVEC